MAKISVIIPVYNKSSALCACLDSILTQTFQDFECILIDDGSTDESGEICDQYCCREDRIKILHKQNGGVSSARNAGIEMAQGKYLMFCDADDTIPPDALENLLRPYGSFDGQLTVGGFVDVLVDTQENTVRSIHSNFRDYTEIDTTDPEALYGFFEKNSMLSSCGKLFRRDIIMEYGLRFDTGLVVLEDYAFVIEYLSHCKRICMIPENVYNYITLATSSIVHRRSRRDFLFDVLTVSDRLGKYLERNAVADCEKFQEKTIYPTLRYSYDILWSLDAPDVISRKRKYERISQAIKTETFQKMLHYCKRSFHKAEYRCLKTKSVWCLLLLHGIQRVLPHKRK